MYEQGCSAASSMGNCAPLQKNGIFQREPAAKEDSPSLFHILPQCHGGFVKDNLKGFFDSLISASYMPCRPTGSREGVRVLRMSQFSNDPCMDES